MKLDKKFIKFHEIGNNKYYLLPFDDELFIGTESFLPMEKKFLFFKKRKDFTQTLKLLQLTGPILTLFNEIINAAVDKDDKEFKDMVTYKKVNNIELRKNIESTYKENLEFKLNEAQNDFDIWKDNLILENKDLSDEELDKIIKANEQRLKMNKEIIKQGDIYSCLSFKWRTGENTIIKKMLDTENMEFLYSQKIGSSYKIYYLYDLDIFGTITMYKIQCVKDVVKSIDSFIYNREVIQEMIGCMVNKGL